MAAPRGGTRERILNAAERLFAVRGYEGTSTRAIVAASGAIADSVLVARRYAEEAAAAAGSGPSPELAAGFTSLAHSLVDDLPAD